MNPELTPQIPVSPPPPTANVLDYDKELYDLRRTAIAGSYPLTHLYSLYLHLNSMPPEQELPRIPLHTQAPLAGQVKKTILLLCFQFRQSPSPDVIPFLHRLLLASSLIIIILLLILCLVMSLIWSR
jgi:hypothetical protein